MMLTAVSVSTVIRCGIVAISLVIFALPEAEEKCPASCTSVLRGRLDVEGVSKCAVADLAGGRCSQAHTSALDVQEHTARGGRSRGWAMSGGGY